MDTPIPQEKHIRGPRKYSLDVRLKAQEYKEKGLNNREICRLLGIKHKMQLYRIMKYPYDKAPIREKSQKRKNT